MNEVDEERTAAQPLPSQMAEAIEKIILRSMNEGVLTLECTGDIYTVNLAALRILGYREEELKGKKFADAFLKTLMPLTPKTLSSKYAGKHGEACRKAGPPRIYGYDGSRIRQDNAADAYDAPLCIPL